MKEKKPMDCERIASEIELAIWMIPGMAEKLSSEDRDYIEQAAASVLQVFLGREEEPCR